MMRSGLLAEFDSADAMVEAAGRLREAGFRRIESFSPSQPERLPHALGLARPWLPVLVFGAAVTGAAVAYFVQWYTNAWDYPLNVGGRPPHAIPAFVLITFESAVLCGSLAAFLGVIIGLRLPELSHPVFAVPGFERATIDRYWVGLDASDPSFDPARAGRTLEPVRPLRLVRLEEEKEK